MVQQDGLDVHNKQKCHGWRKVLVYSWDATVLNASRTSAWNVREIKMKQPTHGHMKISPKVGSVLIGSFYV